MICSRTNWAAHGVALATSALNATPPGAQRGAAGSRRLNAYGPVGESVPAVVPATAI